MKRKCLICMKHKETECSHVDCPNRKLVTANVVGERFQTQGTVNTKGPYNPGHNHGHRAFVPKDEE